MMKYIIVLFVLAIYTYAEELKDFRFEEHTAYGYHTKIGIPEAERIRQEEELVGSSRIAGGVPAAVGQYPFKAGILGDIVGLNGISVCGGSLISASRIATAAHCWFDGTHQAWRLTAVLGSDLLFSGGTRVSSSAVATHPNWMPILARNDVAVIYLATPVTISETIAPIALPTGSELFEDFAGQAATAIGFGATGDNVDITMSQSLSHIRLNVITNSACSLAFPIILQISNVCTNGLGGVGMCDGDSGGPLVVVRNNRPILIGISSFRSTYGCQANLPSVFARVTSYLDFFNQHL